MKATISYCDEDNRCAFNGEAFGVQYDAKAVAMKLEAKSLFEWFKKNGEQIEGKFPVFYFVKGQALATLLEAIGAS